MFTGSVCREVPDWFAANSYMLAGKDVWVGCSGNFTIETVLSGTENKPGRIVSSDVSLYSSALGAYYTDGELEVSFLSDWQWLEIYASDIEGLCGVLVVLLEMSPFASRKTAFHRRVWDHYVNNFREFHNSAVERLRNRKKTLAINEYKAVDVVEFIEQCPKDSVFLSFMPTYAGGYEKLYSVINKAMTWQSPPYEMLDLQKKEELLHRMSERGLYVHVDDMAKESLGIVAIADDGHKRAVYIHTNIENMGTQYYHSGAKPRTRPRFPLLSLETVFDEPYNISVVILKTEEFAWVRDQYLAKKIIPAEPSWKFGVCVNGVIVGLIGFSRGHDGESY